MTRYLLSIYQPDGPAPAPELLEAVMRKVNALNTDLKAAGAWVFACGLQAPDTATVLRMKNGELLTTDGPYVEGQEHLGGFTVIEAPDLDAAKRWAGRLADALTIPGHPTGLAVEVRPFQYG